ncbi:universal stress protein [Natronorarus salvus]|uniref:universal stress protein n=1 Tax=Natronorarus salvus TaxID=3117733 RepID=UPI002F2677C2
MKLLLGIGGTDDSLDALWWAAERTSATDDELTVAILENPDSDRPPEEIEAEVETALSEQGLDAEIRHLEGDPGGRLVDLADDEGYDQIVIGGGERSPMGKIQVGRIAEFVVLNARTTVTLVRR